MQRPLPKKIPTTNAHGMSGRIFQRVARQPQLAQTPERREQVVGNVLDPVAVQLQHLEPLTEQEGRRLRLGLGTRRPRRSHHCRISPPSLRQLPLQRRHLLLIALVHLQPQSLLLFRQRSIQLHLCEARVFSRRHRHLRSSSFGIYLNSHEL